MRRGPTGVPTPEHPMGMKVLSAGFPKSGTTSLREACRALGLRPCMDNPRILEQWYRGEFGWRVGEDFISGFPFCLEVERCIDTWPEVRVILCTREVSGWIRSLRRWMRKRVHKGFEVFTEGLKDDEALARMYAEHNQSVRKICERREVPLLEVSWESGDGWPELCGFLGLEIPNIPFPHEMRS